jgi:[protein-PII] uridylyltransferase
VTATLNDRLDAIVSGPGVRPAVAAILKTHHDAAREKVASRLAAGLPGVEVAVGLVCTE